MRNKLYRTLPSLVLYTSDCPLCYYAHDRKQNYEHIIIITMRTCNIRFCAKVGLTQRKIMVVSDALLVNKTTKLTEWLVYSNETREKHRLK